MIMRITSVVSPGVRGAPGVVHQVERQGLEASATPLNCGMSTITHAHTTAWGLSQKHDKETESN